MPTETFQPAASSDDRGDQREGDAWRSASETRITLGWIDGDFGCNGYFRFPLGIAPGSKIVSAEIELYEYSYTTGFGQSMTTDSVDGICLPFTDANYSTPSDVSKTEISSYAVASTGSRPAWIKWVCNETILKNRLQALVDDDDYVEGDGFGLVLIRTGFNVQNVVSAWDEGLGLAARLNVTWRYRIFAQVTPTLLADAPFEIEFEFSPSPDEDGLESPKTPEVILSYVDNEDVTLIAPASNPEGYRWRYWDFGEGDKRTAKTQEFQLDATKTIIGTYVKAGQTLAMDKDPAGIMWAVYLDVDNGDIYVRYRTSPHSTWSEAQTVATGGSYAGVGICVSGGEIVVQANSGTTLYQWHSLDGGDSWTDDGTIS